MKVVASSQSEQALSTYANDFFDRAYFPWLEHHPERLEAAMRLGAALKRGAELRSRLIQSHHIDIPETLVVLPYRDY
jgi:hypothetical protein